ncbi:hypothetical protein [uncultured Rikenella sp.]|uniref:hypothetical protein n=1 Tax=uncultured Rikenella sp. TaxID=368003 RepID=UPI002607EBA3|nr:hypothetical protein [uncultured Rikenella sp.]
MTEKIGYRDVSRPGLPQRRFGEPANVGYEGTVWSVSTNGTNGIYLRFVMEAVQPSHWYYRTYGRQLRCLSE